MKPSWKKWTNTGALRKEIREQGDASDTPVDGTHTVCVCDVTLPEARLVELLDKLRASVVADMETRAAARKVKIRTLTDERLTAYTEELEERLRTQLAPKGRSEVSFRQPREGELIAHRQRKERHLRVVLQRDRLHSKDFLNALAASYEKVETFKTDLLQALEDLLPKQQSLATLQGVESRCKKPAAAFHVECLSEIDALGRYTATEPTKLFQLNEVLLESYSYSSRMEVISRKWRRRSCEVNWSRSRCGFKVLLNSGRRRSIHSGSRRHVLPCRVWRRSMLLPKRV